MDIRQLQYFIAVAEEGGFRRAAARLNITQPPLSLQIQALERSIGVALFDRSGHKIKLTSAGEALLRRSRAIVEAIGNARQETLRVGRGEVGRLVVGVMSGALLGRLSPLLAAFREAAPDVDVAIDQRSPADQIAGIRARRDRRRKSSRFRANSNPPTRELRSRRNNYGRKNWRSPCPPIIPWQRRPNCR